MIFIKTFDAIQENEIELVGGKGLSLGRLAQADNPVPSGFVITTDAYKNERDTFSSDLQDAVFKAFDALGAERVAVRSSAIAEDSSDASWAGQFESYLNVNREQLIEAVKKCWDSASSDVVEAYAQSNSVSSEKLAIAVVVQKMVNSEVSGVAFSVNPVSNDTDEIMVEAIYGLGELLVQGMITPDNYVISKNNYEILERSIKNKPIKMVFSNGENVEEPVADNQREESCLTDEQLTELAKLIVNIEQFYGKPQDVEWAVESDTFYIVQSRPITTLK